jgi:hypothetical protein
MRPRHDEPLSNLAFNFNLHRYTKPNLEKREKQWGYVKTHWSSGQGFRNTMLVYVVVYVVVWAMGFAGMVLASHIMVRVGRCRLNR